MDIEGLVAWPELREVVRKRAPYRLLRDIYDERGDIQEVLVAFVEGETAGGILSMFSRPLSSRADLDENAMKWLVEFCEGTARPPRGGISPNDLSMRVFDTWATLGDVPGAIVSELVIRKLGQKLARMAFDSGRPGSGQVLSAYKLARAIYLVSDDIGVYACHSTLRGVLREWGEFDHGEVWCPSLSEAQARRYGLFPRQHAPNGNWRVGPSRRSHPADSTDTSGVAAPRVAMKRVDWVQDAANDGEAARECEGRGDLLARAQNFTGAAAEWRLAASKGSGAAHWKLAILYRRGLGVGADVFECARRCRSAAEWGHPAARRRLAKGHVRLFKSYPGVYQRISRPAGESNAATTIDRIAMDDLRKPSDLVTLIGLLNLKGRQAESLSWISRLAPFIPQLRADDAIVLEVSGNSRLVEDAAAKERPFV